MSFMDNHIQKPWAVTQSEVLTETNTSEAGLSDDAVRIRQKDGLNELAAKPPKTTLQMIKEQIIDPMIMILIGAAFFSALFHEYTETIINCYDRGHQYYYWYCAGKESSIILSCFAGYECSHGSCYSRRQGATNPR